VVAAAAAIVGDNLGFWLTGRRGGRALIARNAWVERRAQRVLPRAEALIARYGGRAIFFGRFVSVLRETIAWVAGLAGMSAALALGRGARDWVWLAATVSVALPAEVALSRVYAQSF
jgi:membrane protein DedA with SNARE-associated domain